MFVRDSESNHIFTDNTPYKFKIQLKRPLRFEGHWKIALCEISLLQIELSLKKKDIYDTLFIYCDLCKDSIVDGGEQALLRRVDKSDQRKRWIYVFESPFYLSLNKSEFQEIEFTIKTVNGEYASFITSPTHLTLHFRRYPFYS